MTRDAHRHSRRDPGARLPISFEEFRAAVAAPARPPHQSCHPLIIQLEMGEGAALLSFCRRRRIVVIDSYERQLHDLAAARLPSGSDADRQRFVAELVAAGGGWYSSGMWVFLPWESKIAHLLGPDNYFEVITDRNRDKITRPEQQMLRTRKIGVMGLSLGGEAAVTVAQEHLCGHLVLADFDRLDLSNLNRLSAGFDDLGLPKTTIAARRVARIDPYLRVDLYEEGVKTENIADFLGGLDLLIEECDGLGIKFEVRVLARERGLNVVFAGDERGFLSVEPHAHEPELPPFHGRIEQAQPPREAFPTSRAFLKELTEWLGGWEQLSERTRQSLERVGDSLCGYPQLASEARFAAGQVGHVARRLLLGERVGAFIGHVDLTEILPTRGESGGGHTMGG